MNKVISIAIIAIYSSLALFVILTWISPNWLKQVSKLGKEGEAREYKGHGDYFLEIRDFDMAIVQFDQAIKIYPDFAEAYINRGIAFHYLGDYKNAMENFKKALTYKAQLHDLTYFHIAEIFRERGEDEKAIKYYLQSASFSPYPIFSYQKAGELLSNNKQYNQAFKAYYQALDQQFSMKNCYQAMLKKSHYIFNMQYVTEEIKRLEEQKIAQVDFSTYDQQIFDQQAKFHIINATLYNQFGYLYIQTNQMDSALICFEKALQVAPDFTNAKLNYDLVKKHLDSQTHQNPASSLKQ